MPFWILVHQEPNVMRLQIPLHDDKIMKVHRISLIRNLYHPLLVLKHTGRDTKVLCEIGMQCLADMLAASYFLHTTTCMVTVLEFIAREKGLFFHIHRFHFGVAAEDCHPGEVSRE